ncbi:hypothetical protein PENANT_c012G06060 [Penicillium antarcticum]|uniref:Uncharacterized protein n=1 Tax=Penicillium antarcticum TaxID=416450 RepID=A0A1V6Q5M1_9EURO|nr:hypothetical protein PENANT_c012G06060 [Penicillium antarcticum]
MTMTETKQRVRPQVASKSITYDHVGVASFDEDKHGHSCSETALGYQYQSPDIDPQTSSISKVTVKVERSVETKLTIHTIPADMAENAPGQASPAGSRNQPQTKNSSSNVSNLDKEPSNGTGATKDELNYYREFLDDMVTVMRDGNGETVQRLVNLIRSGVSKAQIHQAIQQLKNDNDLFRA